MAFDRVQTRKASIDSIHKPTSSQGLKLRIRSLFLTSAKSFGRSLSLDSSTCLESQTPFARKCAYSDVRRAIVIRLSRQKHKNEDEREKKHKHKHTLSDTAISWTPTYSLSRFPSSGTSRYSYAYLGGSRPSMSLEKALRENERLEETCDIYWSERGSSERSNIESAGHRCGVQLKGHNASRNSMDDEDLWQKTPNSSLIKPDILASSPLDATFTDEYRTSISHGRDGQLKSSVDTGSASCVSKMDRREANWIPMRRRSILQTPGVATRTHSDPISWKKAGTSRSYKTLASASIPAPSRRRGTQKGAESEQEAQPARDGFCTDRTKEAIRTGASREPGSGFASPESSLSRRGRLSNTDSVSFSSNASTKSPTRPAEQPRVTEVPSSAAVDHLTCTATSAGIPTVSTSKTPAPSSKPTSSTKQLTRRPRQRAGQSIFLAEPNIKSPQLPCRRPSEASDALTKGAEDVSSDRDSPPSRHHGKSDTKDGRVGTRPNVPEHGCNTDEHVECGAHTSSRTCSRDSQSYQVSSSRHGVNRVSKSRGRLGEEASTVTSQNAADRSRSSSLLRVQDRTNSTRRSELEAPPPASATQTVHSRENGVSCPQKPPGPAAIVPCSSLQKRHAHSRPVTSMSGTRRPVPHPPTNPTGHSPNLKSTPHKHEQSTKTEPKHRRGEPGNGASQFAAPPPPPPPLNLSKELPLEPPRKNTLRSTFFKRPRRTTQHYFPQRRSSLPTIHASSSSSSSSSSPTAAEKTATPRGGTSPYLHYYAGLSSRHSQLDLSSCPNAASSQQQHQHQHQHQQQDQDKRKHSTLLHRPAFSDIVEAIAFDGARGSEPRYRVLHSYNSPAYKNLPIWG
ncbi:hypothetical protein E4U55_003362 [Claviceps digitariae]|nr:hypothetical protein E4U55_003362 [Claviceps digitariae]